ncbi:MAG: hypothetical protein IJ658_05885 [Kiritimatiellae bacterium]|nr:hypothetical protein [Kiritimatiellia bacterium]
MKATINAALALAAAMAFMPAALTAAPEKEPAKEKAAAEAPADEGPTPAQLKARKMKKPVYMKASEALNVAEAANQPILLFFLVDRDPASDFLRQKVTTNKLFRDELAKQNFVLLTVKIKPEQPKNPREKPKKIDLKGMKDAELKLIQNFGRDEKANKQAMANGQPERTYMDIVNYPAVIGLSPDGAKHLFRMGRYDKDGGMGVWISTVADTLRAAGFEPVVTPKLQKVLDNPDDPKKWK